MAIPFSHPQQGRIDFKTVNPSLPTGMDFLIHPSVDQLMMRRMSVLHPNLGDIVYIHCREEGCIGLYIPDDQEISRGPRDVPRAKPEVHLKGGEFSKVINSPIHPDSRQ